MSQAWIETISSRLGPPVLTTGEEVRFNCWRSDCGSSPDTKAHLYVNPIKGKYFCQRCQRGGSLEYLFRSLGLPNPEKTLTMWDQILNAFLFGEVKEDKREDTAIDWPDEYQKMIVGTQAYQYLRSRGLSDKKIEVYQLGFGIGKLKNRIIFPDVDSKGVLRYWVARSYGKHYAKYKNATAPRETQVYNLGRVQQRGYKGRIIICEGPISAIAAGYEAVATYGKYVTGKQIERLVQWGADEYVIAGDGDAVTESVSLASRLYKRGCAVKFVRFAYDEDPASVGGTEIRRRIRSATEWHALSAMEVLA